MLDAASCRRDKPAECRQILSGLSEWKEAIAGLMRGFVPKTNDSTVTGRWYKGKRLQLGNKVLVQQLATCFRME